MKVLRAVLGVVLALVSCGCGSGSDPNGLSWTDLLGNLTNSALLARLDVPATAILTSYDPAGSNDDYNHYIRKGPAGWIVLADLKGPGYVSRFWTTGADDGKHRVRFYFDGERKPSLELTLDELTGGREPFKSPLACYENYCWYSFIPIPYAKRLVIMTQEGATREGGWPRIFYQINYSALPQGQRVRSFTGEVSAEDQTRVEAVRSSWSQGGMPGLPAGCRTGGGAATVAPGASAALDAMRGPGIIRELRVTPDFSKLPTAAARERALRDVILRITWDGAAAASVEVPLGDFFGSVWRRTRYNSMYFGLTNDTFVSRFPMPFQSKAVVSFENQGALPVDLRAEIVTEPLSAWDPGWGYFHASWSRSGPGDLSRPHTILRTKGKGRYAGCILSALNLDRSWWLLEGDEKMYFDGETSPRWHGTGLEDYFDGGWYYQNVLARPLHGLSFKAFFRVVQYRLHLLDPVMFDSSFDMVFERGPDNASHGWMENVAYYYLSQPAASASRLGGAVDREPPRDPLAEATVMTEILNHERFGDYQGASDYIDGFLEAHATFPMATVLRLRQIAYVERMKGFDAARPLYEKFVSVETNAAALEQAKLLLWFHESPTNALLVLYSNARARAFLDGRNVCNNESPEKAAFAGVTLGGGVHGLAVQAGFQPYPSWVQAALRTHEGLVTTQPDWRYKFNPSGAWSSADYDAAGWPASGGTGVKGPPEEPYVWLEPNAFVDLQSQALGLRPQDKEWPGKQAAVAYRTTFGR